MLRRTQLGNLKKKKKSLRKGTKVINCLQSYLEWYSNNRAVVSREVR